MKCPARIGSGDALDLCEGLPAQLGEAGGSECYKRRLVALAAMRSGGEEGTVGLHQQPLERDPPGGVAQRIGRLEGEDPAQADVEPEREIALRRAPVAGEAVDDPAFLPQLLLEERGGV